MVLKKPSISSEQTQQFVCHSTVFTERLLCAGHWVRYWRHGLTELRGVLAFMELTVWGVGDKQLNVCM